jgi:hypothetical protein
MNSANDKYGSSLDRPQAPGKPVDPATRLSELLAQSLVELTRPFDSPRGPHPSRPADEDAPPRLVVSREPEAEPQPEPSPEQARADADKALAELEAELFAAAKQVDRDASIPHTEGDEPGHDGAAAPEGEPAAASVESVEAEMAALLEAHKADTEGQSGEPGTEAAPALAPNEAALAEPAPEVAPDAAAAAVIARVRRLMLVSMAVTIVAVGSVFAFIGYRLMKGEGATAKTADKLPPASSIPNDITLSLPRNAKIIQSAVANDRLIMTIEVDGKVEVRTFDVKTLQPAARLNFSATP